MITRGQASFSQMLPLVIGVFFSIVLDETVTTMILPKIEIELHIETDIVQWYATAYYVSNAAFAVPLAHSGDIFGYRRCLQFFFFSAFVSQLITFFLKNFYGLLALRFITGLCYAGVGSTRNALMAQLPRDHDRKQYVMWVVIINNSLSIAVPIIGGAVVQYVAWQYVYLICSICCLTMFGICFIYEDFKMQPIKIEQKEQDTLIDKPDEQQKEQDKPFRKEDFDWWGVALMALSMSCFCTSFTLASIKQYIGFSCLLGGAIIFFTILFYLERHQAQPLLPRYLFVKPISSIMFLNGLLYFLTTCFVWMVPQILYHLGKEELYCGIMTAVQASCCMLSSVFTPIMNKKMAVRVLMVFSYSGVICGYVGLIFSMNYHWVISALYCITFFFFAIQMQLLYTLQILAVPPRLASYMAGMPTCTRTIGQSISLCLFSMIQGIIFKKTENYNLSYQTVVYGMLVFVVVGIITSACIGVFDDEGGKCGGSIKQKYIPLQNIQNE